MINLLLRSAELGNPTRAHIEAILSETGWHAGRAVKRMLVSAMPKHQPLHAQSNQKSVAVTESNMNTASDHGDGDGDSDGVTWA